MTSQDYGKGDEVVTFWGLGLCMEWVDTNQFGV